MSSPPPDRIESILIALLNEITTVPDNFVLVLDDYHVIDAKPVDATTSVDDALTFLLEHRPPQMHLVIATREDPHLPLARLRARSQLTELRAADLFTSSKAAEFLNQVMGLNLHHPLPKAHKRSGPLGLWPPTRRQFPVGCAPSGHQCRYTCTCAQVQACPGRAVQGVGPADVRVYPGLTGRAGCKLDTTGQNLLKAAMAQRQPPSCGLQLSARAFHRTRSIKLARTIADLVGAENISPAHLACPFAALRGASQGDSVSAEKARVKLPLVYRNIVGI